MLARDIMNPDVITIRANAHIYELTRKLSEGKISGLPVCNEMGQVVGIVSEADLIGLKHGCRVKDIMSREGISVGSDTPVQQVACVLAEHRIKRVPVYDGDDRLVGIISRADIVDAMARGAARPR
ncbi:MAG: CBS domain-containing protein [Clostridia bacterium]|nr:CBS domain-containing protein [Clostridia bacterium]